MNQQEMLNIAARGILEQGAYSTTEPPTQYNPAADLYERFPELRQWQQDRSEWHNETILEIISEFIEWQRAQ